MITFHHIYKYSHKFIILRQFVCLNYFKNTLLTLAQSQVHWKQLIADRSQERSKYSVKIYPFFEGFTKFLVKNTPISRFREIGFKIPLFSWKLEHTLDHKWPWRVATGEATCGHQISFYINEIHVQVIIHVRS